MLVEAWSSTFVFHIKQTHTNAHRFVNNISKKKLYRLKLMKQKWNITRGGINYFLLSFWWKCDFHCPGAVLTLSRDTGYVKLTSRCRRAIEQHATHSFLIKLETAVKMNDRVWILRALWIIRTGPGFSFLVFSFFFNKCFSPIPRIRNLNNKRLNSKVFFNVLGEKRHCHWIEVSLSVSKEWRSTGTFRWSAEPPATDSTEPWKRGQLH